MFWTKLNGGQYRVAKEEMKLRFYFLIIGVLSSLLFSSICTLKPFLNPYLYDVCISMIMVYLLVSLYSENYMSLKDLANHKNVIYHQATELVHLNIAVERLQNVLKFLCDSNHYLIKKSENQKMLSPWRLPPRQIRKTKSCSSLDDLKTRIFFWNVLQSNIYIHSKNSHYQQAGDPRKQWTLLKKRHTGQKNHWVIVAGIRLER